MNPLHKEFSDQFDSNKNEWLEEFKQYLRFKTISTQKKYQPEMKACVEWLTKWLQSVDFDCKLWETSSNPCLFCQNLKAGKDKPKVLIYLHYDVQPVDPLDLWDSPPFEPRIEKDLIFARGACDNKGQAFYTLCALRSLYEKYQSYPVNLKIIIEGDEEVGSEGLTGILEDRKNELACDYFLIVDSDMPSETEPVVGLGFRGICTSEITLKGTNSDLHSGLYGGVVLNPLQALCKILTQFHDENGKVTIPHFYDDVCELSPKETKQLYLKFDAKEFRKVHGTDAYGGENEFTAPERMSIRPTFEINGIWGGYIDEGFKTVIPSLAHAKVSMRLVPNQDPLKIKKYFSDYIETLVPKGIELSLDENHQSAHALWADFNTKATEAADKAISEVFGKPCLKYLGGGSLPIGYSISEATGAQTLGLGLALSTDQIHAPNEHFAISRIKKGYLIISLILSYLGE